MTQNKEKFENILYLILFIAFILLVVYINKGKMSGSNPLPEGISIAPIESKASVMDAINNSAVLLNIPENKLRISNSDGTIITKIGIDRTKLDLNYANAIITTQLDKIGAKLVSGLVKYQGSQQELNIIDNIDNQAYQVRLYYSKDYSSTPKTKLAIVVDDFGAKNNLLLENFCSLDPAITFAILPDLKYSKKIMEMAYASGHETMIHLPMEPISYPRNDPGPNAIYVHLSPKEIETRMERFIAQFPLSVGANNHMGSLATSDSEIMKTVLNILKKHDLFFVDSRTSQSSIAYSLANEMMIPTAENKLFLDTPNITSATIDGKLRQLEYLKKHNKQILVITHCATDSRYQFLKKFIIEAEKRNFEIVPVSDFFKNELPEIL